VGHLGLGALQPYSLECVVTQLHDHFDGGGETTSCRITLASVRKHTLRP